MSGSAGTDIGTGQLEPLRGFTSIDVLRGIASLGVVLYHGHQSLWGAETVKRFFEVGPVEFVQTSPVPLLLGHLVWGFGYLGVSLFFVISGFCIHLPFAGGRKQMELWPFAKRRFLRLYPLYILMVFASFAWVALPVALGYVEDHKTLSWENFFGHFIFWYYNVPEGVWPLGINVAMWSIALEAHFYILYAVGFFVLMRLGLAKCAFALFVAGCAYYAWWYLGDKQGTMPDYLEPRYFSPARFGEWLIGAWIAELYVTGKLRKLPASAGATLAMVGGGLALIAGSLLLAATVFGKNYKATEPLCTVGFAIIFSAMLAREMRKNFAEGGWSREANPVLRVWAWLGDRSYSLYLCHLLVFTMVARPLVKFLKIEVLVDGPWYIQACRVGMMIGASIVVAHFLYLFVEKPSHQWARKFGKSKKSPTRVQPGGHMGDASASPGGTESGAPPRS